MSDASKTAVCYRMVMPDHVCPYGLKSVHLLKRKGYRVDDRWLRTREETDAFKARTGVGTTPQTFIGGQRIGGHDALRRWFGLKVRDPDATSYQPVLAVFAVAALLALATGWAATGSWTPLPWLQDSIAFGMCLLAMLKLQDVESFSTMFLNYDLLARRWVPYAWLYPFGELLAGVLMLADAWAWIAVPVALFIGSVGAVSVFKAVYIDRRELECACVGGGQPRAAGLRLADREPDDDRHGGVDAGGAARMSGGVAAAVDTGGGHVGVLLAAGGSRRLGTPKQLLRRDGQSLIRRTAELVLGTGAEGVFVVLGAACGRMQEELDGLAVTVVVNDAWSSGLASSLQAAAEALPSAAAARVLLVGVDQPALDAPHLQRLLAAARQWPGYEILSGYAGIGGIPAVVAMETFRRVGELAGDRGLKDILVERPRQVVDNPALAGDVDTPEALARLRREGWLD